MEKPIYKSEGMSPNSYKLLLFLNVVIGIVGIIAISYGMRTRSLFDYLVSSSKLKPQQIIIIGVLLVVVAILDIATTITMNKSKLYVYTDRITGVSSSTLLPFSKNFDIKYNQIANLKYVSRGTNRYIKFYANGVKHTVPISGNVKEAYELINRQLFNK